MISRVRTALAAALLAVLGCEPVDEPRTPYAAQSEYEPLPAPDDQAGQPDAAREPVWPRRFTYGDTTFATHEPLVDAWKDDKLEAHAAVEAYPQGATTPKYGLVWFEAPTQTDRARGLVTLGAVRVLRAHFPTATDREAAWLEALRSADLAEARTVSVDRLQREIAYAASQRTTPAPPASPQPPIVLAAERPTVLVQVDGAPQLRDEGGVQRVVNTRALVLTDRGSFYVWVGDRWFRASSINGAYAPVSDVPPAFNAAKDRLAQAQDVDLLADSTERVREGATVVVATKPTELIETRGAPVYEAIPGTNVSYVSNTESDVLRDDASGQTYVLLSPGWFRALTLGGPFTYVAGRDVPASFRQIPRDHREARVLVAIPGTPEAEEADIAATIPQTASVDRSHAQLAVSYEGGAPDFRPVEGTSAPLSYALNASTPVISTGDGLFYAVENGVWFVAPSPNGPWTVASSVPDVVYSIPPSSPIHYVTYVRVYGYSPDYVYVGYLPGYLGAYYTYGGFGFGYGYGYGYRPWLGRPWYGSPYYRYGYYGRPGGWRYGAPLAGGNVYTRWAPSVVHAPPARYAAAPTVSAPRVPASPSMGQRVTPRVTSPAAPYGGPRVTSPAAPSYGGPRVTSPAAPSYGGPRVTSPASPSYSPRVAPRVAPPPASPSFTPRAAPPSVQPPSGGRGGAFSGPAVVPPRTVAPPSFAPRLGGGIPGGGAMRSGPSLAPAPAAPRSGPAVRSGPVRSAPPARR